MKNLIPHHQPRLSYRLLRKPGSRHVGNTFADETAPNTYGFEANSAQHQVIKDVVDGKLSPQAALDKLKDMSSTTRFVGSAKGDVVSVYAFFRDPDVVPGVKFKEEPRELLIAPVSEPSCNSRQRSVVAGSRPRRRPSRSP